jgi:hypothetical protein
LLSLLAVWAKRIERAISVLNVTSQSSVMLALFEQGLSDKQIAPPLILTSSPADWLAAPADWQIYDLSPLRAWKDAQGQFKSAQLLDWFCRQLPAWGWPQASIKKHYSFSFNGLIKVFDLSLDIKKQGCVLVGFLPELKLHDNDFCGVEYELQEYGSEIGYDAICISDGRSFSVSMSLGDPVHPDWEWSEQVYVGLPTPQDFGFELQFEAPQIKRIESFEALSALLAQSPPDQTWVMDSSLLAPIWPKVSAQTWSENLFLPETSLLDLIFSELNRHSPAAKIYLSLPKEVLGNEANVALREAILAHYHLRAWLEYKSAEDSDHEEILYCLSEHNQSPTQTWVEHYSAQSLEQALQSLKPLALFLANDSQTSPASGCFWQAEAQTPWLLARVRPDSEFLPPGFLDQGETFKLSQIAELCLIKSETLAPSQAWQTGDLWVSQQGNGAITVDIFSSTSQNLKQVYRLRLEAEHLALYPMCDSAYLKAYLESEAIQSYLGARQSGIHQGSISLQILAELPVLLLPIEKGLFADIHQLQLALRQTTDHLASVSASFFRPGALPERQQLLFQSRSTAQLMVSSAENVQKIGFQICHYYPFALANPYRNLQTLRQPLERYKEQLRLFENLLAYLTSLVLALLQAQNRGSELTTELLETLQKKGLSPGHWRSLYQKGLESLITQGAQTEMVKDLNRLQLQQQQAGLGQIVNQMLKAKNDFKHDRGPQTESELQLASEQFQVDLDQLLGAMNFLKDYPLWQVQSMDISRESGLHELACLRHQGDHPALHQELLLSKSGFSRNDLIMAVAEQSYISLYPYLSVGFCQQCNHREVYFMDHAKEPDLVLKSFERGHIENSPDIMKALKHIAQTSQLK